MEDNAELNIEKTTITHYRSMEFSTNEKAGAVLTFKNIEFAQEITNYGGLYNAIFTKCAFTLDSNSHSLSYGNRINVTFVQCYFKNKIAMGVDNDIVNYVNCCIDSKVYLGQLQLSVSFLNCTFTDFGYDPFDNCAFINCVINKKEDDLGWVDQDNVVDNCLGAHPGNREMWQRARNSVLVHTNIFKEGTFYELTDEAKALITSNDGTEIGMYGGQYPYNPIPDGPRITKFKVASKSSADNKLSVDVEVSSAE